MTAILGVSAYFHDAAAALLIDGRLVAAAQEERFSRIRHDSAFPTQAIAYCLRQADLNPRQLDYVGFYEKPLLRFERLIETYLGYAPRGYSSFRQAIPLWLKNKLASTFHLSAQIPGFAGRSVYLRHHDSHAASAFFPSPFESAAILTVDGVGEWSSTCIGEGNGNRLTLHDEIRFPHSLGLLYSAFTHYLGFKVNSGEYKVMGLAPYGSPRYEKIILEHLIDLKADGSFRLDMRYFGYGHGLTMTNRAFHQLFGEPPRYPDAPIGEFHMDVAASIQAVTEQAMLRLATRAHQATGSKQLVMAGGVALNCVANGRILRDGPFEQVWVQPAAGDAGGSVGTCFYIWHQLLEKSRCVSPMDSQYGSLLGPAFSDSEIGEELDRHGATYVTVDSDSTLCDRVAELLEMEKVVGWFQGRMEFGPRALGNRSILGDARKAHLRSTMNLKIKFRESFRPFAPIVLSEQIGRYFNWPYQFDSPYMLFTTSVAAAHRIEQETEDRVGFERLQAVRSTIPAVTHVDDSARVQSVDTNRNPLLHRLLSAFERRTQCPVLINTSFNVRGEPIVCTPRDAWYCFASSNLDALAIGHHLVLREQQSPDVLERARRSRPSPLPD